MASFFAAMVLWLGARYTLHHGLPGARAWQPYQQGGKDFTGEVQGMGRGLATVASLT